MDEFFLEVIEKNLDSKAKISIFISSTQQWIKGIKILSVANETLRYTYYEVNVKEKPVTKKLIERITPLYFVLDVKIEHPTDKGVEALAKDYEAEYVEEDLFTDEDDGGDFVPLT